MTNSKRELEQQDKGCQLALVAREVGSPAAVLFFDRSHSAPLSAHSSSTSDGCFVSSFLQALRPHSAEHSAAAGDRSDLSSRSRGRRRVRAKEFERASCLKCEKTERASGKPIVAPLSPACITARVRSRECLPWSLWHSLLPPSFGLGRRISYELRLARGIRGRGAHCRGIDDRCTHGGTAGG